MGGNELCAEMDGEGRCLETRRNGAGLSEFAKEVIILSIAAERAKKLLWHYFSMACEAGGHKLSSKEDCRAEIDEIVDSIIEEAVEQAVARVGEGVQAAIASLDRFAKTGK